jgi:hypothetical protein
VNAPCVREKGPSSFTAHEHEEEIARRWWALPLNVFLRLSNGDSCQLLYAGRPGGSLGPDVRDAVLRFTGHCTTTTFADLSSQDAINTVGDVEIHIRASDWFAHQHHTDARYNNVLLHVVLICDDDSRPTLRQDGTAIPTCSLYDLPRTTNRPVQWPCHHRMARMNEEQRARLLTLAGIMRFEQKAHALLELLRDAQPTQLFSACDVCLIPALAEGLGYGRDRAFFRAAGLHLIGRAPEPSPLDASRLHILHDLVEQWRTTGAWETLRKAMTNAPTAISDLRNSFDGLSKARTDILICNVVLPFAATVAQQENDAMLAEQARNLFIAYPALPSNQITRAMGRQLLLQSEPKSACQQQGLHFIYAQTCREKRCIDCMLGKQGI